MASLLHDSEEQRFVDRVRCITYREIRDEMIELTGNSFITRQWISKKLRRSEDWVTRHWNNTVEECYTQFGTGQPHVLSQKSKNIISSASGVRGSSSRNVARAILEKTRQQPRSISPDRKRPMLTVTVYSHRIRCFTINYDHHKQ
jgi:hypothetical protein